ncbi:MAG: hypothetical protein HDR71_15490 [Lachnospiraceae bacterium]|nr:hypothetical protein [Lachnospiraceae bacterium]
MSQVVEITIDLTNPDNKPRIETFGIINTGKTHIYCVSGDVKRRFFIPDMNEAKNRGPLKYAYRYRTEESDYRKIMESDKTSSAINEIVKCLENDLDCYQKRLEATEEYYELLLE